MTYAQILAGGVSFQLYNKSTNAVVPTSVSDGGGYIEITEDATSDHNTIYKIDQFVGAVSEITLYTEGDSAKTYALLGASFDESVHTIRSFYITRSLGGDTIKLVSVEIDGRLYIPFVKGESVDSHVAINNGEFYESSDFSVEGLETVFPTIEAVIEDSESEGDGYALKIPSFDNITTMANESKEVVYDGDIENNAPWKYGQDGIFSSVKGSFIRVNGVNRLITFGNKTVSIDNVNAAVGQGGGNIYTTNNPTLRMEVTQEFDPETAKEDMWADWGLEFGEDIVVSENVDVDFPQPFISEE